MKVAMYCRKYSKTSVTTMILQQEHWSMCSMHLLF